MRSNSLIKCVAIAALVSMCWSHPTAPAITAQPNHNKEDNTVNVRGQTAVIIEDFVDQPSRKTFVVEDETTGEKVRIGIPHSMETTFGWGVITGDYVDVDVVAPLTPPSDPAASTIHEPVRLNSFRHGPVSQSLHSTPNHATITPSLSLEANCGDTDKKNNYHRLFV
jgi:hypothetical protein